MGNMGSGGGCGCGDNKNKTQTKTQTGSCGTTTAQPNTGGMGNKAQPAPKK